MANYGIPYMGSKDAIIHKIAPLFPKADNFYDLFGGGFSVSHFMRLHHASKYKNFFYNEIKADIVQLVRDAIAGKYNYNVFKPTWISREEFAQNKDKCAYTRCLWSFGNNQKGYLFSVENEFNKRSLHNAVVFNNFDALAKKLLQIESFPMRLSVRGRRLLCRNIIVKRAGTGGLQRLRWLQQLQQLERLQRLERLEQLERLELSSHSYCDIKILPNSVIYCDPPYKGTVGYITTFDHEEFWEWVRNQAEPVFVSEYAAPKDIKVLMAFNHKKSLAHKGSSTDSVEKLFGNAAAQKLMILPLDCGRMKVSAMEVR